MAKVIKIHQLAAMGIDVGIWILDLAWQGFWATQTQSRYVKIRIICNGMKQICKNPASNILGNGKSLQGQNIHIDLPLDYGHLNLARSVTLEAEAWVTVVS